MSNYNNEVKVLIPSYMNRIISELNKTNDDRIKDLTYKIAETEDTSVSNYLSFNSDSYMEFRFEYKFDDTEFQAMIKVPKEIAGVFVIGGKIVIPYNELVTDFRLKFHKGILKIDDQRKVEYRNDNFYLIVNNMYSFNLSDPELYAQIPEEYLTLSSDLQKLAKSKVMRDTLVIDVQLCKELIKYDEAQGKFSDITDVTIKSVCTYLKNRLNKDFYSFMNSIRYKFRGGNKSLIGQVYTNEINKAISKYFSVNQGNFNYFYNVTNPLTLQSLSTQVKVPHGNSLNASIFDLIDVVDTPINNNINKINYLNRNVTLKDGSVQIKVYDLEGNEVWLDRLDYISSYILESECWNYNDWKLSDLYQGKSEVLAKFGKYSILVDWDDIQYIEIEPNKRTSITSSVIPMINKSELGRMAMGTSMVKQGVNLINAEDPLVTTEDLSELIKLNPLIITSGIDGKVVSVTRTGVKVRGISSEEVYKIPYALQSYTGNLVPFVVTVELNQEVKSGDILIAPSNISPTSVKYGINAIAAFNAYFGYNSDDSIVISESFADRLSSVYAYKQVISISNVESIKYIKKPGVKVNSNDVLVSHTVSHKKSKYWDMLDSSKATENILHKTAMNNIIDAFLYEVNISMGSSVTLNEESFEIIDEVNRDIDLGEYEGKTPLLPETELKANPNEIKIEFSFLMKRKALEGDKLTNRYGNKGVIAKIVPDKDMIRTEDGVIADICLSKESLPARKNVSQIYELYLGQISKAIKELYYKSPEDKVRAVGVYNTLYKTSYSVDEYDDYVRRYGDSAFNAKVGSYSDINADEVIKAINDLGIRIKNTAYIGDRKLKSEVLFGPMYIVKLPFLPENTLSITTSKKLIGSNEPEMGLGTYRVEGQKLGEMESTALSVNAPELLEYYKELGGVGGNLNRLYFDFLSIGLDVSEIADQIIQGKDKIREREVLKLTERMEGKK
jgi:DNA-directed RNA polymerase beta subunit